MRDHDPGPRWMASRFFRQGRAAARHCDARRHSRAGASHDPLYTYNYYVYDLRGLVCSSWRESDPAP